MNDLDREIERDVQKLGHQLDTLQVEVVKLVISLQKCKVALESWKKCEPNDYDPAVDQALESVKECGL